MAGYALHENLVKPVDATKRKTQTINQTIKYRLQCWALPGNAERKKQRPHNDFLVLSIFSDILENVIKVYSHNGGMEARLNLGSARKIMEKMRLL